MTIYLVSYDLNKQKDYQKLYAELNKLGSHRTQDSVWLVNSTNNAQGLKQHLLGFVDKDDSVWVSELTKNHAFTNAHTGTNDWLKKNPPSR